MQKGRVVEKLVWREDIPQLCVGAVCLVLGLISLFQVSLRGRMMLLLGLCSTVWGGACIKSAMGEDAFVATLVRGVYFLLFGAGILLSNLAGIAFSARVLGVMLFLYGTVPLAFDFAKNHFLSEKFFYHLLYAVLGGVIVLFAGEKGFLPAFGLVLFGTCLLFEVVMGAHNFLLPRDSKSINVIGR